MACNWRLYQKLAVGILRDGAAAADARQRAFVNAMQQPAAGSDVRKVRPWLAEIVRNECLRILRECRSEERALAQYAARSVQVDLTNPAHDLRVRVLEALENLPEPIRSTVRWRIVEGMSGSEVKKLLGCSESKVSMQLHEGMEILRAVLRREDMNARR